MFRPFDEKTWYPPFTFLIMFSLPFFSPANAQYAKPPASLV